MTRADRRALSAVKALAEPPASTYAVGHSWSGDPDIVRRIALLSHAEPPDRVAVAPVAARLADRREMFAVVRYHGHRNGREMAGV